MTGLHELLEQVSERYDGLGLPCWPDPHPGTRSPRDEEYSRLTRPERYVVVHARARVWAGVLADAGLAVLQDVAAGTVDVAGRASPFRRGARLTPSRPGALPLLLLESDVPVLDGTATLAVLHVGVERPDVSLAMLPDCGCDACDFGSADLLDAVDEAVTSVVRGPFVVVRGPGWQAQWHPDGGQSGGDGGGPDHRRLMDLCRRLAAGEPASLPQGAEAFVGAPWLA